MKKIVDIFATATIFTVLTLFGLSCSNSGQKAAVSTKSKKVIKLSHSHQASFSSEIHTTAWIFQKWVNDFSNDLQVKIYPSNALGQEREIYEAMQLGSGATCVISGTAILNNFLPQIGVLDLPFLWKDYDHVHRVLDGKVGDILSQKLEAIGFKVLAWLDSWGYRNIVTANHEIKKPEDIRGLKIRTIQTPFYIATIKAMGANPTPMAFGEVYTGMQTGVVDGFEHNATVVKANKFYEVAKYMALTRHLFGTLVFIYSKKEWDKLSPEDQEVIQNAADFACDVQRSLAPIRAKEALVFLKEHGMIIHEIDTKVFRDKAKALQDKLAKENGTTELLQMIRDAE